MADRSGAELPSGARRRGSKSPLSTHHSETESGASTEPKDGAAAQAKHAPLPESDPAPEPAPAAQPVKARERRGTGKPGSADAAETAVMPLDSGPGHSAMLVVCLVDVLAVTAGLLVRSDTVQSDGVMLVFARLPLLLAATAAASATELLLRLLLGAARFSRDPLALADAAITLFVLYLDAVVAGNHAWRMLALLRFLLRGMRLVAHLREAHREDVQALEARLAAETRRASALSRAAREAQDALRREGESRRRTEQMLRAYKDEYETMQDALAMAADTVALMKAREGGGGGGAASPADSDVDAILEALSSVSGREGGPTPST